MPKARPPEQSEPSISVGALQRLLPRATLAGLIHAMHRKNVLGEVNTSGQNRHGLPLPNELMRVRNSHRGTWMPFAASRLVRDGEVPFIR
jgi:hypothetical protein